MCCPHGKACGGHLSSLSIQQSMLELHTTSVWAAKIVVCGCAPHPTSCSQLVHLLPQMLLHSSVFAAAIPSESCPVLLLSSSKWPCGQGWAGPYPFLTLRLLRSWLNSRRCILHFSPVPCWCWLCLAFFPKVSFFLTAPCVSSLICLFRRFGNVTGRADECQGWLGSSKWQVCQVLHRSPSGSATETWHWCLCSNASTWVQQAPFPHPRAQGWVNLSFSKVMWQDA